MAAFNKQQTGLDIIRAVCGQLGLPVPNAAASNPGDVTARQLLAQLNYAGRRLIKPTNGHRWQVLTRTWVQPTSALTTTYPLPADWDSFDDLTAWNYTARGALLGPVDGPQWQMMKASSNSPGLMYRVRGGLFELPKGTQALQDLRIEYTSRAWVRDATVTTAFKDSIETDGDVCLFDPELMTAALKLRFLTAKGFDTTAAQGEYDEALEAAICADKDAPMLSLVAVPGGALISERNVPGTGFGSR